MAEEKNNQEEKKMENKPKIEKKIHENKEKNINKNNKMNTNVNNEVKSEVKAETRVEVKTNVDVNPAEKKEDKKEEKKVEVKKAVISKKEEAVAKGVALHMSKRQGMYISTFIKGKKIDQAIKELEEVIKLKRAIPFKGEIPHRKGRMMSGRYPVNASKLFISLLKALKGNSIVNGLDLEKTRIFFAHSTLASRPSRKSGKGKRSHITLKAKEFNVQNKGKLKPKETTGVLGGGKK